MTGSAAYGAQLRRDISSAQQEVALLLRAQMPLEVRQRDRNLWTEIKDREVEVQNIEVRNFVCKPSLLLCM